MKYISLDKRNVINIDEIMAVRIEDGFTKSCVPCYKIIFFNKIGDIIVWVFSDIVKRNNEIEEIKKLIDNKDISDEYQISKEQK